MCKRKSHSYENVPVWIEFQLKLSSASILLNIERCHLLTTLLLNNLAPFNANIINQSVNFH